MPPVPAKPTESKPKASGGGGGVKEFIAGLLTGVLLCAIGGGYYYAHNKPAVRQAQHSTAAAIQNAVTTLDAKLEAWHLTSGDIEKELNQSGKVVRRQMRDFGTAIADAASDAKITGKIKAKFALDKDLNTFGVGVSTTDGRVTLTGNVTSSKQISRAIMLALETEGVREVSSTVKVKR